MMPELDAALGKPIRDEQMRRRSNRLNFYVRALPSSVGAPGIEPGTSRV
jgi:hypothetical protein